MQSLTEFAGGLTKNAFESTIELRERLESHVVGNLADAKIRVQQPAPRVFEAHARDIVGEL